MKRFDAIITGTGRCGTGYVSQLLKMAGLECGHERFFSYRGLEQAREMARHHWTGTRAESGWLAAPFLDDELLAGAIKVHLVRHPKKVIQSLLKLNFFESEQTRPYVGFIERHVPQIKEYESSLEKAAFFYVAWNELIEIFQPDLRFRIEDDPGLLLAFLGLPADRIFENKTYNTKFNAIPPAVYLNDISDPVLRGRLAQMATRYGYEFPAKRQKRRQPVVKAVITTLDNLPMLKEQIQILRDEPIDQIVVVNNGSRDGTGDWLREQPDLIAVHQENKGAGPGRNAGMDAAGKFDYVLMLDGGIRPLRGGTRHMLDYLERQVQADVIAVEIPDFETDYNRAWRRWPEPITKTYQNTRLSHTAYCLARHWAFAGLRFCEDGPFGEPGWGADDDELAYQWNEAGIVVHVATGIHPYRRASGSFRRLFEETGIWPNQYGSVYEKRLVWLQQNWPQHEPGIAWGEPWLTVVIEGRTIEYASQLIIQAHRQLRKRRFAAPYQDFFNPYSIVLWTQNEDILAWAEDRRLRQFHGDALVQDGRIVRHKPGTEAKDFRVWPGPDWQGAIRENAYFYGWVGDENQLSDLIKNYNNQHPRQVTKKPPAGKRKEL